jgi:hypothetical protein
VYNNKIKQLVTTLDIAKNIDMAHHKYENRYRYAPNVLPNNPKYFLFHALNKPNYYAKKQA